MDLERERRLAIIMATPRGTGSAVVEKRSKRRKKQQQPQPLDGVEVGDVLRKWAVWLAMNQEAQDLKEGVEKLLCDAGLEDDHPVWNVKEEEEGATTEDTLRWCREVLGVLQQHGALMEPPERAKE